jgi:hypothetical protein
MRSNAILLLLTAAALSGQSPLSVCDVLQRLDELHGKRITVKARYRAGEEIANLYDPTCPSPALVDGVKRAPAIHVTTQLGEAENDRIRPLFTTALDEGKAIELTVEGEFHSQQPGARTFGHLGMYPAELKITRIIHFHAFKDPTDQAWSGSQRATSRATSQDICTVFHNLPHWHGKTVAIRGRYRYSRERAGLYGTDCPELRAAIDIDLALPPAEQAKLDTIVEKTKQDNSAIDAILLGHFTTTPRPKLRVTKILHPADMSRK